MALLVWLGEYLPEQRVDGSIEQLRPLFGSLLVFGVGTLFGVFVLRQTSSCSDTNWFCTFAAGQAGAFIGLATAGGIPYAILETTEWIKDRKSARLNARKSKR